MGREQQLALGADLAGHARTGAGQVLVLQGEAGIGKSAILTAWAELCRAGGAVVLHGYCDELGMTRPFAPLVDALSLGPDGPGAIDPLRKRMQRGRAASQVVLESEPGLQHLVAEDLVARIEDLCVRRPVVLILDDLQWVDSSTLGAIAALVRRSADLPLLLIVATRVLPRRADVASWLAVLRAAVPMRTTFLELHPLEADEVTRLAAVLLGASPAHELVGLLGGCAGNPLLIVELLASLRHAMLIAPSGDTVELVPHTGQLQLPTSLTDLVRQRMAGLDEDLQAVATVAALLGTRFTLGDLAVVTARAPAALYPLVQTLVDARLLSDDGHSLAYRHALVREAVVSGLAVSVRAELHVALAASLRSSGASTIRVAEQLVLGAGPGSEEAVEILRAAAEDIVQQDPVGATALVRHALEICSPTAAARDLLFAQLVDALAWSGDIIEAQATAEEVLSRPLSWDAEVALRSGLTRSLLLLGRPIEAIGQGVLLVALHASNRRSTARALSETAVCRVFGLDFEGALRDATEAVRLGEVDADDMAVILGLSVLAFAHTALGDSAHAVTLADQAAKLADATSAGEGHRLHPNLFRGIALQSLGRSVEARHAFERGRLLGESLGAAWAEPIYHLMAALAHWDSGRWDDLLTEIDAGTADSNDQAFSIGRAWACAIAGRVHVHRGQVALAGLWLDEGERIVAEHGLQFGADWLALSRALLLETQGRAAEAHELLGLVWEAAAGLQARSSLVLVGGDLARIAVAAGDHEGAMRVAAELARVAVEQPDDLVVRARERYAHGMSRGDASALGDAAEAFHALGHVFEMAQARREQSDLLLASGDVETAVAGYQAALAGFEELRAVLEATRVRAVLNKHDTSTRRRPSPRRPVSGWGSLTPTEWEVVEEVCAGRSNRDVAERLGISRRTVEAHLRGVYVKLQVATRLALAIAHRDRDTSG